MVRFTQLGAAGDKGVLRNPAGPVALKTDLFALLFDFSLPAGGAGAGSGGVGLV